MVLPDAANPLRRKEDLVVGGLDVGGRQRRAVVKPDAWTDPERVGQPVGRDLPIAGHVPDDVRVTVGSDLQERAVERGNRLDGGEGLLLVRVGAGGTGGDGRQRDAATPRRFRLGHRRSHHADAIDRDCKRNNDYERRVTSNSYRHRVPPRVVVRSSVFGSLAPLGPQLINPRTRGLPPHLSYTSSCKVYRPPMRRSTA